MVESREPILEHEYNTAEDMSEEEGVIIDQMVDMFNKAAATMFVDYITENKAKKQHSATVVVASKAGYAVFEYFYVPVEGEEGSYSHRLVHCVLTPREGFPDEIRLAMAGLTGRLLVGYAKYTQYADYKIAEG